MGRYIEEIEQALTMEIVMEHYGIEVHGSKISCPLPNHGGADSTPSFSIKDEHFYKCFGCGSSGSPVNFIMDMEEISYLEAVQIAGQITGIEPVFAGAFKEQGRVKANNKLMEWLNNKYFTKHYYGSENWKKLNDYLDKRKISIEVGRAYGLGYSDGEYEEVLLDKAVELKCNKGRESFEDVQPLIDLGLLRVDGTGVVATLKDCITFPIYKEGVIVGFEGRNLNEEVIKKYGKYNKSACKFKLFNSEVVDDNDLVHVFEGIFDCLTAIQCGYPNSVALLGVNALGEQEKAVLLRANMVCLHFDDDETGRRRALEIAEELGYKAYVVEPIGVGGGIKDLNGLFVSAFNTNLESMNEEDAFNKAVNDVNRSINKRTFGTEVESDDEDAEPKFEGGAKNLVEIYFQSFLEITNEIKRIEALKKLIEIAYKQYDGDSALLDIFANKLKLYGIKGTYFKEVIGKVKKEVSLEKPKSSNINSSLAVSNIGQGWVDWEVINGVLYKNIPEFREDGSFPQEVISITAPKIDCIFRSITKDEDEIQISFIDKYGRHTEIITERKNISQKYKIVDTLTKKPFDIVDNTSADIVKYLNWYENTNIANIGEKYLTNVTGYYNKDIFIGRTGEIIIVDGLADKNKINVVHKNINKDISANPINKIDDDEWKELIRQLFPRLLKLNECENSIGVIGWFLCSMYKEPIQLKSGIKEHAPLNIVGKQGSGKTTLATFLQQMQGGTGDVISASSKKYTIVVNMSLSNSYALIIDEYKIKDIGEFQNSVILNLVKVAYNSNFEQRGNGNNPMNNFLLLTPVCVIGENAFTGEGSEAVRDRSAIFEFSRTWKVEHEDTTKKIIREINKLNLNFFNGGYAKFILNTVNDGRFDAMYERAEERANKFADENEKITSRNITAITQLGIGIEVLKELYKIAEIECDITDEDIEAVFTHSMQHILNEQNRDSSLDNVMNYFTMIAKREFLEDEITCDFSEGLLYVQQSKFYTLLSSHAKQGKADIPSKDGLRILIKDDVKDKNGYVKETDKLKSIKNKNKRCLVFDIDQLEKIAGIDKSTWIGIGGEAEQEIFTDGTSPKVYQSAETRNMVMSGRLADKIVTKLKQELKGDIVGNDKNSIKSEIYGILTERLENKIDVIEQDFVSEMVLKYLKRYESCKYEEVDVKEIFKEDKIS